VTAQQVLRLKRGTILSSQDGHLKDAFDIADDAAGGYLSPSARRRQMISAISGV